MVRTHRLKKRLAEVLTTVSGCRAAFEQVQEDELMALMYLTALEADAAIFDARLRARSWNTDEVEMLLDSYEQEMASMTRQLMAMQREIEATEAAEAQARYAQQPHQSGRVVGRCRALAYRLQLISGYYGMNLINGGLDTDLVGGSAGPANLFQVVLVSSGGASVPSLHTHAMVLDSQG